MNNGLVNGVNVSECDKEPIHLLGKIQSAGALIALTDKWNIEFYSSNASDFLETPIRSGMPLSLIFGAEALHVLRGALHRSYISNQVERILGLYCEGHSKRYTVSVHHNGIYPIMEFESSDKFDHDDDDFLRSIFLQSMQADSLDLLLDIYTLSIQSYTNFDRVMIYKFLDGGSGEVVAETCSSVMEPFLGLRYPASDIPQQARKLYLDNTLRMIIDTHGETLSIHSDGINNSSTNVLDLSKSQLRAVSEIHIEYLKNMQVRASLSVSIIVNGELWGLIACHHNSPKTLACSKRIQLDLLAQVIGMDITKRLLDDERKQLTVANAVYQDVQLWKSDSDSIFSIVKRKTDYLTNLIKCEGIVIYIEENVLKSGNTPPEKTIDSLIEKLTEHDQKGLVHTNSIAQWLSCEHKKTEEAAGMLAISISNKPNDYILFFRDAEIQTVKWAGNPLKSVVKVDGHERLKPRASFEEWRQKYGDMSRSWQSSELKIAESIRIALIEMTISQLRAAKINSLVENDHMQAKANEQKEVLIRELNHRVRNILNLVSAVISQTNFDGREVGEFSDILSSRIQALASAHDQLVDSLQHEIPVKQIFETEMHAYQHISKGVKLSGPNCVLKSEAVTPLVLMTHELFTNSIKHGAFSQSNLGGKIDIDWHYDEKDGFHLCWREIGQPADSAKPGIKPISNSGFGMTIIKTIIPHELNGAVDVSFLSNGLQLRVRIPPEFVVLERLPPSNDDKQILTISRDQRKESIETKLHNILVVEDSAMIAVDIQEKLKKNLNANVNISNNVKNALNFIHHNFYDYAMLDINLKNEVSFPLAEVVSKANIPFCFLTGLDEKGIPDAWKNIKTFRKPISNYELEQLFHDIQSSISEE